MKKTFLTIAIIIATASIMFASSSMRIVPILTGGKYLTQNNMNVLDTDSAVSIIKVSNTFGSRMAIYIGKNSFIPDSVTDTLTDLMVEVYVSMFKDSCYSQVMYAEYSTAHSNTGLPALIMVNFWYLMNYESLEYFSNYCFNYVKIVVINPSPTDYRGGIYAVYGGKNKVKPISLMY